MQDLIGETDLLDSISAENNPTNEGGIVPTSKDATPVENHSTSPALSVGEESQCEHLQQQTQAQQAQKQSESVSAVTAAFADSETDSDTESEPEMPVLAMEEPLPTQCFNRQRIVRTHNGYSAHKLKSVLDQTCSDLFKLDGEIVPGYPLNKLFPSSSENSGKCKNVKRSTSSLSNMIRLVFSSNSNNAANHSRPPRCPKADGIGRDSLSQNDKNKNISVSRPGNYQQQEEKRQQYTFQCSGCSQTWPLDKTEEISAHFGAAKGQSTKGCAPSDKSLRLKFSAFFKYFSYRVRMLVNPVAKKVTSKTVVLCNTGRCDHEFDLRHCENLAANLNDHLVKEHPEIQDVSRVSTAGTVSKNKASSVGSLCYFCDRRVNDLQRHLAQYEAIHSARIINMAPLFHGKSDEEEDEEFDEFEVECKHCGDFYTFDKRLPDWLSRSACNKCILALSATNLATNKQKRVVLCAFCRQGKFGYTKSACEDCSQIVEAFRQLTDKSAYHGYVTGMLNDLVSVYKQREHCPTLN